MCEGNFEDDIYLKNFLVNYKDWKIIFESVPQIKHKNNEELYISTQIACKIEQVTNAINILLTDVPQINDIQVRRIPKVKSTYGIIHNRIVKYLEDDFYSYFEGHKISDEIFARRVPLYVGEDNNTDEYICPDFMVVDQMIIQDDGVHGAPRFVAEVVSDKTREIDYKERLNIYKSLGVEEYWILDLGEDIVIKYLKTENFIPIYYCEPNQIDVTIYPGLVIFISAYRELCNSSN